MERVRVKRLSGGTVDALSSGEPVENGALLYEAEDCKDCSNMDIESCPSKKEAWHAQLSVTTAGGDPLFVTRENWQGR